MSRKRRLFGRELWERGLKAVEQIDDLPTYACGEWTVEKLYFLSNYLAQMTRTMVGNPTFTSVNYIDLFASCGVCALRDNPNRRYPGSALLASLTEKPFDRLLLVEKCEESLKALVQRMRVAGTKSSVMTWDRDCNDVVQEVIASIPDRSLSLAFVDPFSLDISFSTLEALASNDRRVDLLILFADDYDLIRNVEAYYYPNTNSKLDAFLGPRSNWRTRWDALPMRDAPRIRQLFADIYLEQLHELGYKFSKTLAIPRASRPLYRLVFASKNPLGLKFWEIAESEDLGGNRSLFGIQ